MLGCPGSFKFVQSFLLSSWCHSDCSKFATLPYCVLFVQGFIHWLATCESTKNAIHVADNSWSFWKHEHNLQKWVFFFRSCLHCEGKGLWFLCMLVWATEFSTKSYGFHYSNSCVFKKTTWFLLLVLAKVLVTSRCGCSLLCACKVVLSHTTFVLSWTNKVWRINAEHL